MTLPLLEARLKMLRRNLTVTHAVSTRESTDLVLAETINPDAWKVAFGQVSLEAQTILFAIDDFEEALDNGMDPDMAWKRYRTLRDRAQRACRDCFELVGGFALREKLLESDDADRLLDRRVTAVTEAIALVCRNAYDDLQGMLAMPAPTDAVSRTMARIVRARFPDWTVWTLPAAAYEYAHAVLSEIPPIQDAIATECRHRVRGEGLTERSLKGKRRAEQLQAQLVMLYADAFAARVMGPAYASAMIVLRLDPLRSETNATPSDRDRAATILEVIHRAYPASAGGAVGAQTDAPWRFVRAKVTPLWADLCTNTGTTASKKAANGDTADARAEGFVKRNWRALRDGIMPAALYPYSAFESECWQCAIALADHWKKQLKDEPSEEPEIRGFRDILNAAWICRVEHPDRAETLTRWTREACDSILQQHQPRALSTDRPDARQSTDARPPTSPLATT